MREQPQKLFVIANMDMSTLYPLDRFYQLNGKTLPPFSDITAEEIPQPQKQILAHDNDMTPTIEVFCGEKVRLDVQHKYVKEDSLYRKVVLVTSDTGKIVVFGAIRIYLLALPARARRAVLDCHQPLGNILQENQVSHRSHPRRFFTIETDQLIGDALKVAVGRMLFGRVNTIKTTSGAKIVEVVEILPPLSDSMNGANK